MKQRRTLQATATIIAVAMLTLTLPTVFGHDDEPVGPEDIAQRSIPKAAGVERDMTFYFGPFTIPAGQDNNRVTLDIPIQGGFLTDVQANVYDVSTGARPSNQDMHIHHAHWFRVSDDANDEYYISGGGLFGISWVFGTGEERTKGDIDARSAAEGDNGPSYGVYIEPGNPQALIYMLHNKNAEVKNVFVGLDVTFVYGNAEEIAAAQDCGLLPLEEGEQCRAGEDFHHVFGTLFGNTYDVERNFDAWHAGQTSLNIRGPQDTNSLRWTVTADGTGIGSAGHMHPNGVAVVLTNEGPAGSGCEADIDGDGFPGIRLMYSNKYEQIPGLLSSEEYQMGVTQDGWRVPVRVGDRIGQYGVYRNEEFASYEAMSFAGFYTDRQQVPMPVEADCTTPEGAAAFYENSRAYIVDDGVPQPFVDTATYHATVTATKLNDDWAGRESHGHCGWINDPTTEDDESKPCNDASKPVPTAGSGARATEVHVADFLYVPGDMSLSGDLAKPAQVEKGEVITFVNEDVAIGVRHSVTSCKMPCNGQYVANYPQPDGYFDSDKMGNLDYIDGGVTSESASPVWELDTNDLDEGIYSYYCRIHPWMRGWIEVA